MKYIEILGLPHIVSEDVYDYVKYLESLSEYSVGHTVVDCINFLQGTIAEIFPNFYSIPQSKLPNKQTHEEYLAKCGSDMSVHVEWRWLGIIFDLGLDKKTQIPIKVYSIFPLSYCHRLEPTSKYHKYKQNIIDNTNTNFNISSVDIQQDIPNVNIEEYPNNTDTDDMQGEISSDEKIF